MEKLKMQTPNKAEENFKKLSAMFPNAVTEVVNENGEIVHAIDTDILQQEISGTVIAGVVERYQFTWPDKKKSVVLANQPINKTLRLDREKSVGKDGTQGSIDTENIYIEGDNLDALKLLQETYLGKIKMIYIDPPYNTGNDFIYEDDFSQSVDDYLGNSGQTDDQGNRLVQNSESNGRFHTNWLNMIYPRLRIAKDLLSDDGIIFISIDDNEQENAKKVCNEIFGGSNFISCLIWKSKSGGANDSRYFAVDHEYVLAYAKNSEMLILNLDSEADVSTSYNRTDENGAYSLERLDKQSIRYSSSLDFEIVGPDGTIYTPKHKDPAHPNATWRWSKSNVEKRYQELVFENGNVYTKNYKKSGVIPRSLLIDERFGRTRTGKTDCFALFNVDYFSNPKPIKLLKYLALITTKKDDIVLDFFSGSATTAQAIMQLNLTDEGGRKFILVQIPEECPKDSEAYKAGFNNICSIGEERIRRAGEKIREEHPDADIDIGFRVFKVDSSNMKDVYYKPDAYEQGQIDLFTDNIKEGRTPEDLLFQVMLDLGISLSSKIEESVINDKKVFVVGGEYTTLDGSSRTHLIACFDKDITDDTVKAIAKKHPSYAVFRDSCMANDSVATNFEQIFEIYSPDTVRKVL